MLQKIMNKELTCCKTNNGNNMTGKIESNKIRDCRWITYIISGVRYTDGYTKFPSDFWKFQSADGRLDSLANKWLKGWFGKRLDWIFVPSNKMYVRCYLTFQSTSMFFYSKNSNEARCAGNTTTKIEILSLLLDLNFFLELRAAFKFYAVIIYSEITEINESDNIALCINIR